MDNKWPCSRKALDHIIRLIYFLDDSKWTLPWYMPTPIDVFLLLWHIEQNEFPHFELFRFDRCIVVRLHAFNLFTAVLAHESKCLPKMLRCLQGILISCVDRIVGIGLNNDIQRTGRRKGIEQLVRRVSRGCMDRSIISQAHRRQIVRPVSVVVPNELRYHLMNTKMHTFRLGVTLGMISCCSQPGYS